MSAWTSRFLLAGFVLAAAVCAAHAQGNVVVREVKTTPGAETNVGMYADIRDDCTSGPLPGIRLVTPPAHGVVSVRRGTVKATNLKQCLGADVAVFVAFYRATKDFNGTDQFDLQISFPNGRKVFQHFHVVVSSNGARQGI